MSYTNDIQLLWNLVLKRDSGILRASVVMIPNTFFMRNYKYDITRDDVIHILMEHTTIYNDRFVPDNITFNTMFSMIDDKKNNFSGFKDSFRRCIEQHTLFKQLSKYPVILIHSCMVSISENTEDAVENLTEAFIKNLL